MNRDIKHVVGPRAFKSFIDRKMEPRLESIGIRPSYGPFILCIEDNEGISLKELSAKTYVDKALTTRVVQSLTELDIVTNLSDGARRYNLVLTEKGKNAANIVRESLRDIWGMLLKDVTEEEKIVFNKVVEKMGNVVIEDESGECGQ